MIAKAGKPPVKVVPISAAPAARSLGFRVSEGIIYAGVKLAFKADVIAVFAIAHRILIRG